MSKVTAAGAGPTFFHKIYTKISQGVQRALTAIADFFRFLFTHDTPPHFSASSMSDDADSASESLSELVEVEFPLLEQLKGLLHITVDQRGRTSFVKKVNEVIFPGLLAGQVTCPNAGAQLSISGDVTDPEHIHHAIAFMKETLEDHEINTTQLEKVELLANLWTLFRDLGKTLIERLDVLPQIAEGLPDDGDFAPFPKELLVAEYSALVAGVLADTYIDRRNFAMVQRARDLEVALHAIATKLGCDPIVIEETPDTAGDADHALRLQFAEFPVG